MQRENIHFILVRSQFASNLGSTVRIMKNMGFEKLILVQPQCEVGMEARSYAMKGSDILDQAAFFPSLEAVTEKINLLVGTTGRYHGRNPKVFSPRNFVHQVLPEYPSSSMGVVIGSEDNGLWREELTLCNWLVEIPTGSDYPVINLAQAAAIVAYELNLAFCGADSESGPARTEEGEIEPLLQRISDTLSQLDLSTRLSVDRLMLRIRKIVGRARLDREDVNMLHGLLRELQKEESSKSRRGEETD